jgi:uncharacterized protein (DUF1330 family)
MPKGYWIARDYVAHNGAVFKKYGAKFLTRGGTYEAHEGPGRSRNVVIEFKDYATALACYHSSEYQALVKARAPHAKGEIVIVEGYDGEQP